MANSKPLHGAYSSSLEMYTVGSDVDQLERTRFYEARDNGELTRTGKKPVLKVYSPYQLLTSLLLRWLIYLKRNFGFMSILSFSCLVICTWGGAFILLGVGLKNGGPAGVIYSFTLVWIGNLATFASLAELASMAPTAGGQYHWVSILAPQSCQKLLSYITGWLTVAGWQAGVAASAYVCGTLIQGFIELVDPTYEPQLWHATLLLYGAVALSIFTNTVIGPALPLVESLMFAVYVFGFFGVLVPLVYLGPHGSAREVFTTFLNEGGWSSQTLSFFVGISGNAFAFLGADAVYHMSEEIQSASTTVPRAIVCGTVINGVVGLGMYIAILFCMGDVQNALTTDYVYPFIEVLMQATNNSRPGSAVMLAILIIVDVALVVGVIAASSRMLWAFARDRGVPGWRHISKLDARTSIPTYSILTTTIVSLLIGLISVGSPVAFNDVISLTVSSLYASYFVACVLLLWRRSTGSIKDLAELAVSDERLRNTNLPGSAGKLVWGPWKIREPFGTIVNATACVYLFVVFIFTFFPPATPVTPNTMNYGCLVMGFVAIMSGLYYAFRAHRTYTGPVVDVIGGSQVVGDR